MRAGLLALGLALCLTAPLSAQNPDPAPAADTAAEPQEPAASGPIVLVSGPDALLAQFGTAPLDPDASVCLNLDEEAMLTSDRVTFLLVGRRCYTPSVSEREAFDLELRVLNSEAHEVERHARDIAALAEATAAHDAAVASGDAAATRQALEKLEAEQQNVAAQDNRREVDAERERRGFVEFRNSRGISLRLGFGEPSPVIESRPVIFRVASASPGVLDRFPRGTVIQRTASLCLTKGEQLTILGSHGQSVTYTGPGCLKRQGKPIRDNLGGFTFGWARPAGRQVIGVAK